MLSDHLQASGYYSKSPLLITSILYYSLHQLFDHLHTVGANCNSVVECLIVFASTQSNTNYSYSPHNTTPPLYSYLPLPIFGDNL